jgi:hypothetical protein
MQLRRYQDHPAPLTDESVGNGLLGRDHKLGF